jgi:hypothetical protein
MEVPDIFITRKRYLLRFLRNRRAGKVPVFTRVAGDGANPGDDQEAIRLSDGRAGGPSITT